MTYFEATTRSIGNIGLLDRAIRVGAGLAILFATLHVSIDTGDAYPLTKLFATIVVLTGITGWDPFYALFRGIVSRMTNLEVVTFSTGNISLPDRALRIVLGTAVLVVSLQGSISALDAYPFIKIFAAMVVLTGIAGWDPLYSAFRSMVSNIKNIGNHKSLTHPSIG